MIQLRQNRNSKLSQTGTLRTSFENRLMKVSDQWSVQLSDQSAFSSAYFCLKNLIIICLGNSNHLLIKRNTKMAFYRLYSNNISFYIFLSAFSLFTNLEFRIFGTTSTFSTWGKLKKYFVVFSFVGEMQVWLVFGYSVLSIFSSAFHLNDHSPNIILYYSSKISLFFLLLRVRR